MPLTRHNIRRHLRPFANDANAARVRRVLQFARVAFVNAAKFRDAAQESLGGLRRFLRGIVPLQGV